MTTVKTSITDPLHINSLPAGKGRGIIGLTFCPGKKYPSQYSGEWRRDLTADLQAIKDFGARALVTLMEEHELADVHVPVSLLESAAVGLGLEWHFLPIRDVSVPDERFEDRWVYSGCRLRRLLKDGERVVMHCLGGLGRTGTIAARLLIELGETADAAIEAVRRARPGTIETRQQESYVRACEKRVLNDKQDQWLERMLSSLIGGALGDAFGYAIEFDNISSIRSRFGEKGMQAPALHDGKLIVSDDTQMTLFTLEGMLAWRASQDPSIDSCVDHIRHAYLDWLKTQQGHRHSESGPSYLMSQRVMFSRRAPGNTCLSALEMGGNGSMARPINDSKGCGGVMRVAPVAWITRESGSQEAFECASRAAALTHGHPSGYLSAGFLAALIRYLMDDKSIDEAIEGSMTILQKWPLHEEALRAVNHACDEARSRHGDHVASIHRLGGGWVGEEALAIAIYSVLSAKNAEEAVRIAANHSGDSDSTASIAGQIWGAKVGIRGIPHQWTCKLDVLDPLLHLAHESVGSITCNGRSDAEVAAGQ